MDGRNTKERIIDAALYKFTARGFSATTVDEIVAFANVAKGSFYHSFESKEDLAVASLEEYHRRAQAIIAQGSYRFTEEPVRRAIEFIQYLQEASGDLWAHGCMLGSLSIEVAEEYPQIHQEVDRLFQETQAIVLHILEPAFKARRLELSGADALSQHLLVVIEGAVVLRRGQGRFDHIRLALERFEHYLCLVLGEVTALR